MNVGAAPVKVVVGKRVCVVCVGRQRGSQPNSQPACVVRANNELRAVRVCMRGVGRVGVRCVVCPCPTPNQRTNDVQNVIHVQPLRQEP